ncbi:MAG TPA: aromatic ring-hydroxylating dioxygenase subunit alpha [Steroidobacteraceae bacterium]|nr:aromatic ring-hydroxylating dioxygenase subunit alpha [Steroidobacteraceae bacterium]
MNDLVSRGPARDGSAYGKARPHSNRLLTEVGPGTPCGELMRRYWQPIAASADVRDLPRKVTVLGEELVLFRDRTGRAGLLYPRCMHRGTSLFYGRIEADGLRCCYHGWLFDVQGRCLDQPCEPDGGRHRENARQPWYPVEERYGLVFAYLGPPEKKPVLPLYDNLEAIGPDEEMWSSVGGFGATGDASLSVVPYSWLHMNDNVMDPFHVQVLHSTFSGIQFHQKFALMPKVDFFDADHGVCYSAIRQLEDGQEVDRISSWLMPNIMSVPDIGFKAGQSSGVSWVVPVDDSHYVQAFVMKLPKGTPGLGLRINGKLWGEMTEEDHQRFPGDFEAQNGQGPISLHSEEHLVTSDRGIMMQRKLLEKQMEVVAQGGDPVGVSFDPARAVVHVRSGNFYRAARAAG